MIGAFNAVKRLRDMRLYGFEVIGGFKAWQAGGFRARAQTLWLCGLGVTAWGSKGLELNPKP